MTDDLHTHDRTVSEGDTIEVGDVVECRTEKARNGSLRVIAVSEGEKAEHVVVTEHFSDDEQIAVSGKVLAVTTPSSSWGSAKVWLLIPKTEYGT